MFDRTSVRGTLGNLGDVLRKGTPATAAKLSGRVAHLLDPEAHRTRRRRARAGGDGDGRAALPVGALDHAGRPERRLRER
jgi:hypothetical protein